MVAPEVRLIRGLLRIKMVVGEQVKLPEHFNQTVQCANTAIKEPVCSYNRTVCEHTCWYVYSLTTSVHFLQGAGIADWGLG